MGKETFDTKFKNYQADLIKEKKEIFEDAEGGGEFKYRGQLNIYEHILEKGKEDKNLFPDIREKVKKYFKKNDIPFWRGKTVPSNTLSSQVSCLNHLFSIRENEKAVKDVMQNFVGDRITIESMEKVRSKREVYNCQYIAFEMVSDEDRMDEGTPTRGNYCTSIDALAIAKATDGKRYLLVIEWKLAENDSGNKAPEEGTSTNEKEIERGKERTKRYTSLINENKSKDINQESCLKSSIFHLPFYQLMRQTLWASLNKKDFNADDYLHIHVVPSYNPMRTKKYARVENTKGVEEAWKKHLTDCGKEKYIMVDPKQVVEALEKSGVKDTFSGLIDYLNRRYYGFESYNSVKS
ncbi:MAG: PGN_0703 family putative restriction endonuclease [Prevotella intermedia]